MTLELGPEALGPLDADRDPNLSEYYVDFGNMRELLDGKRFIVIGAKGTGKSALKRHLAEDRPKKNEQVIRLTDIARGVDFSSLNKVGVEELERRTLAHLMAAIAGGVFNVDGRPAIKPGLTRRLGNRAPLIKSLAEAVTFSKFGVEISLGGLFREDSEDLEATLDPKVESAVQEALNERRLWLLIDNVDRALTSAGPTKPIELIESLLPAITDINMSYFNGRVRAILFLRSEVYHLLLRETAELDKFQSYIWRLKWSQRELQQLVVRRIEHAIGEQNGTRQPQEVLKVLFDANTDTELAKIWQYVFERLVNGPRDLLHLVGNLAGDHAKMAGSNRIRLDDLSSVAAEFGREKLFLLNANFKDSYRGVDQVVSELFRGGPQIYTRVELGQLIDERIRTVPEWRRNYAWIPRNSQRMIEILYEVGAVGCTLGSSETFTFSRESNIGVGALVDASRFVVHRAFEKYLELQPA